MTMDPLSLVTVPMETGSAHSHTSAHHTGDFPQPPYTLQRPHPIDPKYGESVCLNVMYVRVLPTYIKAYRVKPHQ